MHVGFNLVFLVPGETGGMEVQARGLVRALAHEAPGMRFTVFTNREAAGADEDWGPGVATITVPVGARRRVEWVRGEQLLLPRLARRAGVDLLHSLGGTAPGWGAFRRVVTIHDVVYRIHPEAHEGFRSLGMRVLVPLAARRSHRIVTPSASTRADLIRLLGVPAEKVDVIAPGHGSPVAVTPVDEQAARKRFDLGARSVVLTPTATHRHKNLARLLEALALVPPERRPILVLTGARTSNDADLRRRAVALGLEEDTRFTGWIPREDLEGLYALATCLVFPSLYEGFGAPVVEAMARGVPVACSDRGSLPEVAGGAALLFDPEQPREIAGAIEALQSDRELAARLRDAGYSRAGAFTWEAMAAATLATYERTLAASPA